MEDSAPYQRSTSQRTPWSFARRMPRPFKIAAAAAAMTHIMGFGALAALDRLGAAPTSTHRGLYTYLSATLGDAIFLPAMAGGLALILQERSINSRLAEAVCAVSGLLGGLGVVTSWVLDPNPDLNWTLPEAHKLSVPGWYHGLFLILATSGFAWAFSRAITGKHTGDGSLAVPGLRLAILGLMGFVVLIVIDNVRVGTVGAGGTILGTLLGLILVGAILAISVRTSARRI